MSRRMDQKLLLPHHLMRDEQIHAAVKIIKKTIQQWEEPAVGVVARKSHDPFCILIACLLSLRTKDETTAEASYRLFKLADNPNPRQ